LWTNRTTRGSFTDNNFANDLIGFWPHYIRMVVTASNNIDLLFSPNGMKWQTVATARDSGLTVANFGVCTGHVNANASAEAWFDWVRFT
jgi:hypothetical protein